MNAGESLQLLADQMIERGVRRIHVLAWRDLDDPDAGGSEIHADEFMTRWQAAGLRILHRTSAARGHLETDSRHGYSVIRRGGRYSVFGRVIGAELSRRMGPYDALVEIWNGVPWLSPLWCRKPKILVLHHVHGPMWDQILPRPFSSVGRNLETCWAPPLYRKTPTVTLCQDSRADLERLGWHPEAISVAEAGVDGYFHPGGSKTTHPSVLAVGRLAPVKRHRELLEQFAVVRSKVPRARLTIVGEGPLRESLQEWVAQHGASEWVEFTGRVDRDRLRDLYRSSWLITSASLAEGWGLTLTEAAGCGTPAVATDIGGHRSSVVDGQTGVLASLNELGPSIAALLVDSPTRMQMGQRAQQRARDLSWDELAVRVLRPLHAQVVA